MTGEIQEDIVEGWAEQGCGIELDADRVQLRGDGGGQAGCGGDRRRDLPVLLVDLRLERALGDEDPGGCGQIAAGGQGQLNSLAADLPFELGGRAAGDDLTLV